MGEALYSSDGTEKKNKMSSFEHVMHLSMQVIGGVNMTIFPFIIEITTLEVFVTLLQYTERKTQLPSWFRLLPDLMMNSNNNCIYNQELRFMRQ